jgi:hypothetical protein
MQEMPREKWYPHDDNDDDTMAHFWVSLSRQKRKADVTRMTGYKERTFAKYKIKWHSRKSRKNCWNYYPLTQTLNLLLIFLSHSRTHPTRDVFQICSFSLFTTPLNIQYPPIITIIHNNNSSFKQQCRQSVWFPHNLRPSSETDG